MNKKILFLLGLVIIFIISLGPIFASDSIVNSNHTNLETYNQNVNVAALDDSRNLNQNITDNVIDDSNDIDKNSKNSNVSDISSKTITVDGSSENQMDNPTIQNAIDSANDGDTILITGKNYVHVHIVVNKTLNIISQSGTTMSACPSHTTGSGSIGIFYISPEASGTLISGFTLINDGINDESYTVLPYGIYAESTDNIKIENCSINSNNGNGICAFNGNNFNIKDINLTNSKNGILLENMTNIHILDSFISKCVIGTNISYNCYNILINNSNISSNKLFGINLESANDVNITNNYIMYNRDGKTLQTSTIGSGILVNSNVSSLNVKGNYIVQNGVYGLLNTYKVRNLTGHNEIIDNNIFINNGAGGAARAVYTSRFVYTKDQGDYIYDAENDTYIKVDLGNGNYTTASNVIYVWHNLFLAETMCGATLTVDKDSYDTNEDLAMSNIVEIKPGIYEVKFYVKSTGEIANNLNTPEIIFYLNKNNTNADPINGDVYRKVRVNNGVAIADFTNETFYKTNNNLTVLGPGVTKTIKPAVSRISESYSIPDENVLNIKKASLNIDMDNDSEIIVKLLDGSGMPISNENITYLINNTPSNNIIKTDSNGEAIVSNLSGKMNLTAVYVGNRYDVSNNSVILVVASKDKKSSIIEYKNMTQKAVDFYNGERGGYFTVTLKDQNGNVLSNKPVSVGFNGVVYNLITDENGLAKLQINLAFPGIYTFAICYLSDGDYNGDFKVAKITILKKDTQLIVPSKNYKLSNKNKILTFTLLSTNSLTGKMDIPAVSKTIKVTVNGKTYSIKTNKKGIATLKVSINKKGTYILSTKFTGDTHCNGKVTSSRLMIV
ncbi:MAG: nitrous oxide reductase family maturation protein NosD [Methanobrevibacter sp.]